MLDSPKRGGSGPSMDPNRIFMNSKSPRRTTKNRKGFSSPTAASPGLHDRSALFQIINEKEQDLKLAAEIGQTLVEENSHLQASLVKIEKELSETRAKLTVLEKQSALQENTIKNLEEEIHARDVLEREESKKQLRQDEHWQTRYVQLQQELEALREQYTTQAEYDQQTIRHQSSKIGQLQQHLATTQREHAMELKTVMDKATALHQEVEHFSNLYHTAIYQKELVQENVEVLNAEIERGRLILAEIQRNYHECQEMLRETLQRCDFLESERTDRTFLVQSMPDISIPSAQLNLFEEIMQSTRKSKKEAVGLQAPKSPYPQQQQHAGFSLPSTPTRINFSSSNRSTPINRRLALEAYITHTSVEAQDGLLDEPQTRVDVTSHTPTLFDSINAIQTAPDADKQPWSRKLEFVKPLEGSMTLSKWRHLAISQQPSSLTLLNPVEGLLQLF